MTEKEFIEFIIKVVKWSKHQSDNLELPYLLDPVSLDYRRLNNFGLYEDSQGNLGFAIDWEIDGKCGEAEIFIVQKKGKIDNV